MSHGRMSHVSHIHPPRPANCTLFGLEVLFLFSSFSTDLTTLLCKKFIEDFHRAQIVKFVSFTGDFTSKYVVKSIKEACETVHSTPEETCQHATQFDRHVSLMSHSCLSHVSLMYHSCLCQHATHFDRPCKTACFWWVKKTPKDAQECDLGLCKFVGYFHVFPCSYLRRGKGPAVPKRDHQKMH